MNFSTFAHSVLSSHRSRPPYATWDDDDEAAAARPADRIPTPSTSHDPLESRLTPERLVEGDSDILGRTTRRPRTTTSRRGDPTSDASDGSDDDDDDDDDDDEDGAGEFAHSARRSNAALGLSRVVPAFVSRLGGGGGGGGGGSSSLGLPGVGDARRGFGLDLFSRPPQTSPLIVDTTGPTARTRTRGIARGWKAYESIAPSRGRARRASNSTNTALSESDDSGGSDSDDVRGYGLDDDEDDEGPLPGTFVSKPVLTPRSHDALDEPLMGRRTLFVYPALAASISAKPTNDSRGPRRGIGDPTLIGRPAEGVNSRPVYRDSGWIVVYGACLTGSLVVAIKAFLEPRSLPPGPPPTPSLFAATPVLLSLSLLSLLTSVLALVVLLALRHVLRPLLTLSLFLGPFSFTLIGLVAFVASFGQDGLERDAGWKVGVRVFAFSCVVVGVGLARASVRRRKELNRAVLVGELACQTLLHHPPLILVSLSLSFLSTAVSFPFVSVITTVLSVSPRRPALAAYGSTFVLLTYLWTLAALRGVGKATTSGVVGSWYFERGEEPGRREGDETRQGRDGRDGRDDEIHGPGPIEVTKAAFARATGPSLGTVLASSLLTSFFTTVSYLLRLLSRSLRSDSVPRALDPLTSVSISICDFVAGWTEWWGGYTTIYAGLTGKSANESARDVATVLFANRAQNIRDTTLLRLILTLALYPLALLPSLVAFVSLSSSYLDPKSGGYASTFAVLCLVAPTWTARVVLGLVTDAIDALFISTHLDVENEVPACRKAVEAFGEPERDTLATSFA